MNLPQLIKRHFMAGFFACVMVCLVFVAAKSDRNLEKMQAFSPEKPKLESLNWLIGSWHNVMEGGDLIEVWQIKNDSVYSGHSYFINKKDTLASEVISLEQHGDELHYIPTVKGQNEGKAVTFKLVYMQDGFYVFENPVHDFPQRISYQKLPNDSMIAEASGVVQGKLRVEKFPMARKLK